MQPADIARIVSVTAPTLSPDGRRVAFVVTRTDLDANRYRRSMSLAGVDGGGRRTRSPRASTGTEAPRGRRTAFTRGDGEGGGSLRVVPVGGPGETVAVFARPEAVEAPVWSPDGSRIAFAARERTARYTECDDERARPPRRIDQPFSRLDGTGWAIDPPRGVFDPTGQAEPEPLAASTFSLWIPAGSPDGSRIAASGEDVGVAPSGRGGRRRHRQRGRAQRGASTASAPHPAARAPLWRGEKLLFPVEDHGDVHVYRVGPEGGPHSDDDRHCRPEISRRG